MKNRKRALAMLLTLMLALMLAMPALALADGEPIFELEALANDDPAPEDEMLDFSSTAPASDGEALDLLSLEPEGAPDGDGAAEAGQPEPFKQTVKLAGAKITVTADAGVFPAGAVLSASAVADESVRASFEAALGTEEAFTHRLYAIEVHDGTGNVLLPGAGAVQGAAV